MRTKFVLGAFVILIVMQVNVSCKKELFCKNCANSPGKPPVAIAGPDQAITSPGDSIPLDGSASYDIDGKINSWLWTKIVGPSAFTIITSTSPKTIVKNLIPGIYQFELKVTDTEGLFSKDTMQITVMNQPITCNDCIIVFVSNRDGNHEIYSCNADGSQITRLTYDPGFDGEPAWSPDRSHIAFISDRTGKRELYIMNADGSNVIRKTLSGTYTSNPAWSPDGTRIVYSTLTNGSMNLWMISSTSGSPLLLFQAPGYDVQPAWSPDGRKIALVSDWAAYDFVYDIYTINADGNGFSALTGNIFDHYDYASPSWSPSSTKLAIAIGDMVTPSTSQIATMNPDGSGITVIKSGATPWTRTSWSGDGSRIVYTSLTGSRSDVSWVSADGSASGTIVTNGWNADWQH